MENYVARPQISFVEAMKLVFKKWITFTGRSRRSEFWWGQLGLFLISLVLSFIPVVGAIIGCLIGLIDIPLVFRRLHDTSHSGWLYGVSLILGCLGMTILAALTGLGGGSMDDPEAISSVFSEHLGVAAIAMILFTISGIINIIILVMLFLDSKPEANKYGESPKYVRQSDEVKPEQL